MFKLSKSKNINFTEIYDKAYDLLDSIPFVKKKRRKKKIFKFLKYLMIFLGVFIVFLLLIFGNSLINLANVSKDSLEGKRKLENALILTKNQNFDVALEEARGAENLFVNSLERLDKVKDNFFISNIFFTRKQIDDIFYLLETAEILSGAAIQGIIIAEKIDDASSGKIAENYYQLTENQKRDLLKIIYEAGPELNGVKANFDLAVLNIEKVNAYGFLWFLKDKISDVKNKIYLGQDLISKVIPISELLPVIGGYPDSSDFLVLLQNNHELRPTGGFIGTYGVLKTNNGDIVDFNTHDIYHIDMPVKDKINEVPPLPLRQYLGVDKWYMRDSNWSPDWPTSAQKIEWFFHKENNLLPEHEEAKSNVEYFDGVIGITPEFIISLLKISGPIFVDGEKYDENNFMDILQYKVERGYIQLGTPEWKRKEVIGEIVKQLKIELLNLSSSRWAEIVSAISDNFYKKEILVYVKDGQLQETIKNMGWSGEIAEAKSDYFMVVDANMASFKTDASISRNIKYELEDTEEGLMANIKISYSHFGEFDYRTTRYNSYTRVYVPFGSIPVDSFGVSKGVISVGEEFSKTYFGAFISVEPGEVGHLSFRYKLPDYVRRTIEENNYELYVQKQPGNSIESLVIDLNLNNEILSYSPTGFYVSSPEKGRIVWDTNLNFDRRFRVGE
jgi:hypothetical protein